MLQCSKSQITKGKPQKNNNNDHSKVKKKEATKQMLLQAVDF
jgi:hypothetical protein